MRIGGKVVQGCRDLGAAAKAVAHHTAGPIGVGRARAHHPTHLFRDRARTRRVSPAGVDVIKCGFRRANRSHGGGKSAFMGGVIWRHQDVGFHQILHMRIAICGLQPLSKAGAILRNLALGINRPFRTA